MQVTEVAPGGSSQAMNSACYHLLRSSCGSDSQAENPELNVLLLGSVDGAALATDLGRAALWPRRRVPVSWDCEMLLEGGG